VADTDPITENGFRFVIILLCKVLYGRRQRTNLECLINVSSSLINLAKVCAKYEILCKSFVAGEVF